MARDELCFLSLYDLSQRILRREVSPVEVAEAHLARIERLNPRLRAFITVTGDLAFAQAREAEREIARGNYRGPLHGVPVGLKDIIDTAGVLTTQGSSFFRDNVPSRDAECVRRLKEAGAVLIGKCNTHEFAGGPTNINPFYGTCRNPWDPERVSSGSSGGPAVAVAAFLSPGALGSDTGSSIRGPAAMCGAVGLRPTHGRVSLRGVFPNAPSHDTLGPLARTARDAALVLQVIAGYDPLDPTSAEAPVPDFSGEMEEGVRGMRLAFCPDLFGSEVDGAVQRALEEAGRVLGGLGARLDTLSFPHGERILKAAAAIVAAEFLEVHRERYSRHPEGFGEDLRARIEEHLKVTQDDYVRALRERELMRREFRKIFQRADALLAPVYPCTAAPITTLKGKVNGREIPYYWSGRPFCTPFAFLGVPACAVPTGFDGEEMPLSMQVVGPWWEEARVLRVVHAYEEATPGLRNRRPPVS